MRYATLALLLIACGPEDDCPTDTDDDTSADTDPDTSTSDLTWLLVGGESFEDPAVGAMGGPFPEWWIVRGEGTYQAAIFSLAGTPGTPSDVGGDGDQFAVLNTAFTGQPGVTNAWGEAVTAPLVLAQAGATYRATAGFATTDDPPADAAFTLELLVDGAVVTTTPIPPGTGTEEERLQSFSVEYGPITSAEAALPVQVQVRVELPTLTPSSVAHGVIFDALRLEMGVP